MGVIQQDLARAKKRGSDSKDAQERKTATLLLPDLSNLSCDCRNVSAAGATQ